MQNQKARNLLQEIEDLFKEVSAAYNLRVHWGRYLCVMAASFLENAVQAIYEDYANYAAEGNVAH